MFPLSCFWRWFSHLYDGKHAQVQDANPINPVSFCQGIALVTNQKVQCWKDVAMVQTASQPQGIQRPVVVKMLLPTAVQEHGFCSFGRDVKVKQCQTSKTDNADSLIAGPSDHNAAAALEDPSPERSFRCICRAWSCGSCLSPRPGRRC